MIRGRTSNSSQGNTTLQGSGVGFAPTGGVVPPKVMKQKVPLSVCGVCMKKRVGSPVYKRLVRTAMSPPPTAHESKLQSTHDTSGSQGVSAKENSAPDPMRLASAEELARRLLMNGGPSGPGVVGAGSTSPGKHSSGEGASGGSPGKPCARKGGCPQGKPCECNRSAGESKAVKTPSLCMFCGNLIPGPFIIGLTYQCHPFEVPTSPNNPNSPASGPSAMPFPHIPLVTGAGRAAPRRPVPRSVQIMQTLMPQANIQRRTMPYTQTTEDSDVDDSEYMPDADDPEAPLLLRRNSLEKRVELRPYGGYLGSVLRKKVQLPKPQRAPLRELSPLTCLHGGQSGCRCRCLTCRSRCAGASPRQLSGLRRQPKRPAAFCAVYKDCPESKLVLVEGGEVDARAQVGGGPVLHHYTDGGSGDTLGLESRRKRRSLGPTRLTTPAMSPHAVGHLAPYQPQRTSVARTAQKPKRASPRKRSRGGPNSTSGSTNFLADGARKECASCKTKNTPYWRDGWNRVVLCNACGIRYKKRRIVCMECQYVPRKDEHQRGPCPKCRKDGWGSPEGKP